MSKHKRPLAKVGDRVVCGYGGAIRGLVTAINPDPDNRRRLTATVLEDDGETGYWFLDGIGIEPKDTTK